MTYLKIVENPDNEENPLLFMTGFNHCVLGVARRMDGCIAVAYDYEKVIQENMDQGMTEEEAIEYFEFNQYGAYMGPSTPIFIYPLSEEEFPKE